MSEGPDGRDSENNWVIPSAESFPVETVGAAQGDAEESGAAGSEPAPCTDREETAPPLEVKPSTESPEGPKHLEPPHTEEPKLSDEQPGPPPDTASPSGPIHSKVGGDLEEVSCSSSDDDVEGLRKRVGRGAPPVSVGPGIREDAQQEEEAVFPLNFNTLVIAAFGLICIGLLIFSGGSFSSDDDPAQTVVSRSVMGGDKQPPQVIADIQEWIEQHAEQFTGDPSSLQVMSGLLDKVAKENQDIRHMQATLQAQKEELEALLSVGDGKNISTGPQHPGLQDENIRLKDALLKEETSHLAAKEELQNVQEKLEVLEISHTEKEALVMENSQLKVDLDALRSQIDGFLVQKETLVAESQMLRQELDKQRLLVASIRQDLEGLVTKSTEGEDEKLLQERLSEMSSRLAMEAQRSETWEKKYVEHAQRRKEQVGEERREHGHKEWKKTSRSPDISAPRGDVRKAHFKHGKEHGKRWMEEGHHQSQHEEWRSKKQEDKHWRDKKHRHWEGEKAGDEIQEEKESWKSKGKDHRSKDSVHHHHDHPERQSRHHGEAGDGFHPRKGQKDFTESHKRREESEKVKDHRHHDHNKFWKKLSDHQYRVPEGCTGLEDCARKDGVDLFNVELKPVQRKQFEEILLNYLTKTQLSKHHPQLTPLLDGFFEGPYFSHHKIRFKDFVDDVEDFLEDVAKKQMGNDDLVDDFERYVYTSLFGEAATKKRFAKKDKQPKTNKYHKHSGKLEETYDRGLNESTDFRTDLHADLTDFDPIKKHKTHEKLKSWSTNTRNEDVPDHRYKNEDKHNPKNHRQSPKHNDRDQNSGSFQHHSHGRQFHQKDESRHNYEKHNYDPESPRRKNTYKEQKSPNEKFGKDTYKHKNPDKEETEFKHYSKKLEKDTYNKHNRSAQRHEGHHHDDHQSAGKPWKDGGHGHRQSDHFRKNDQGSTKNYPAKAKYYKHDDKDRRRDYHHQDDEPDNKNGNHHQKYEKDYHHKYNKDHHKHGNDVHRDYHHKYDKDHHRHEDNHHGDYHKHGEDRDRDYHKHDKDHHKHGEDRDTDYHKYDKDHHKHGEDRDRDYHKHDKDHHKHGEDRDTDYHKHDKDHHKHGEDRDRDYHKHDKDHHKHGEDRDRDYHKHDKDHHKHGEDRDRDYHKHDKDHHKHGEDRDTDYHKHDKDHHKHGDDRDRDYHKHDKDHHKHGNDRDRDYHKHNKDHHKHGDDRDRDYHKNNKDHHKHGDDRDRDYHKHNKDHHKHGDDRDRDYRQKYDNDHRKENKDKHGNYRYKHDEEEGQRGGHHK
ncbi:pre-B-cell leukemia transcription factor-interacting protein 1-like isoform 2-T2 [Leptodactylus fuscus]|uniref:pre-B-cell leukemia transcription factor-interacting protein 1-like isoform X2 n=1 Tax=Leptodactylus fuscus TaxID=238119 RepID=UPI003F4EF5D8